MNISKIEIQNDSSEEKLGHEKMALKRLEPCAGKLACTVPRGPTLSNESGLLDTSDPNSMQADLIHLRKSRLGSDEVAKWIKRSVITVVISGMIATLVNGIKQAINGG